MRAIKCTTTTGSVSYVENGEGAGGDWRKETSPGHVIVANMSPEDVVSEMEMWIYDGNIPTDD